MERRVSASPGDLGTFVGRRGAPPSTASRPPINPVTKLSQIILDKGLVLDKESRALTLLSRSTGKTSLSGIKDQPLTQP
jgi:hypothetical protein